LRSRVRLPLIVPTDACCRFANRRVPGRYYLAAIGLPILLFAVANVAVAAFGEPVELGLLAERWPLSCRACDARPA
jgi:hypothetical protein